MHKFRSRVVFSPLRFDLSLRCRISLYFRLAHLRFGRPYILITLLRPFGSNYLRDLVFVPGSIRLPWVVDFVHRSPLVLGVALVVLKCV